MNLINLNLGPSTWVSNSGTTMAIEWTAFPNTAIYELQFSHPYVSYMAAFQISN